MKKSKTIIIANETKDLFRVHFYEDCIKFDLKFAETISENADMCLEVITLSKFWVERQMAESDILTKIAILVANNSEKFEPFYFKDYELNKHGKYVDLVPIDSMQITMGKKANDFYQHLLKEEVLKKINKKTFEANLKNDACKELYVENYSDIYKNKALKFYQYSLNDNFDRKKCNIVASKKEVFFGYTF